MTIEKKMTVVFFKKSGKQLVGPQKGALTCPHCGTKNIQLLSNKNQLSDYYLGRHNACGNKAISYSSLINKNDVLQIHCSGTAQEGTFVVQEITYYHGVYLNLQVLSSPLGKILFFRYKVASRNWVLLETVEKKASWSHGKARRSLYKIVKIESPETI
ncbi:MAG: hypothetical protein AAB552_01150 [Patescibacteria group bacterium]